MNVSSVKASLPIEPPLLRLRARTQGYAPGKEEQECPGAGRGDGETDDLDRVPAEQARRHAQQDEYARQVEDELGRCARL